MYTTGQIVAVFSHKLLGSGAGVKTTTIIIQFTMCK